VEKWPEGNEIGAAGGSGGETSNVAAGSGCESHDDVQTKQDGEQRPE